MRLDHWPLSSERSPSLRMTKPIVKLAKPQEPKESAQALKVRTVAMALPEGLSTKFHLQQIAQNPRQTGIPVGEGISLAGLGASHCPKQGETDDCAHDNDSFNAKPPSLPSLLSQNSIYRHPDEHCDTLMLIHPN